MIEQIAAAIPGLLQQEEIEALYRLALQAPPGPIIDLGTYYGLTAALFCAAVGPERVVSIDNYAYHRPGCPPPTLEGARANLAGLGYRPWLIEGQSRVVPQGITRVAMLFVDTEHTAMMLGSELAAWLPLLAPRGIVALHDYANDNCPGLKACADRRFEGWPQLGIWGTLGAWEAA
ncbi:MAG TPA: class I SAM-dependent methyltransferase [Anaerolineae bacterium]|nr:class I SAM-dependent methyltransferase [Anaerolineae bacterium]